MPAWSRWQFSKLVPCALILIIYTLIIAGMGEAAISDKWILSGTRVNMGGFNVTPVVSSDWDIISVSVSEDLVLLGKGECEASLKYRVCFLGSRFNISKKWGRFDAATDTMIPELHITLETLVPQLALTLKSDKSPLLVEEETMVRLTISNPGENAIKNVSFRQDVPDSITIIDPGELSLEQGMLRWGISSLSGEKSLAYRIKFNRPANVTLNGSLIGFSLTGTNLSKSAKLVLKTIPDPNPLTQAATLSSAQPVIGDTFTYTITIKNSEDKRNDVKSLEVRFPDTATVTGFDGRLARNGLRFSWNGSIPNNDQQRFEFSLRAEHTGKQNITSVLNNTFYSEIQSKDIPSANRLTTRYDAKLSLAKPSVTFMLGKKQINASEASNIRAHLVNQDKINTLFDIEARLETDYLGNRTVKVEMLGPGEEVELFYVPFNGPSFTKDATLNAKLAGSYQTRFGEKFNFTASNKLVIKKDTNPAPPQPVVANQSQNKTGVKQNVSVVNNTPKANASAGSGTQTGAQPTPESTPKKGFFARIGDWFKRVFKI